MTSEVDTNATVDRTIEVEDKIFKNISTISPNSIIQNQSQVSIAKAAL